MASEPSVACSAGAPCGLAGVVVVVVVVVKKKRDRGVLVLLVSLDVCCLAAVPKGGASPRHGSLRRLALYHASR